MPSWLSFILITVGLSIVVFITFTILSYFVLSKIKANKWVILAIAVLIFAVPPAFSATGLDFGKWFFILDAGVFIIFIFWFFQLMGWFPKTEPPKPSATKMKKTEYNAPPVIKAKAKPNRLKNTDMEVIEIKDYQNKKKKNNKKK